MSNNSHNHYNHFKKQSIENTSSSSINLKKKKSSQKSINSRKSIFAKQNENFASQMMIKRQKIIKKKFDSYKKADFMGMSKQSFSGTNGKNYIENSSLYPSLANSKYSNSIIKRKKKESTDKSLIKNSLFYNQKDTIIRRDNKKVNLHRSPHQRGYMLAKNLSESILFQDKKNLKINSNKNITNDNSEEQSKIKSQDKYVIHRERFIQRSKNLNRSLQNYQSNSQPKKVIHI